MAHLLILEARYYEELNDNLLAGAKKAMDKAGATFDVIQVPGSYELPAALEFAAASTTAPDYDGYVLLGCLLRGETSHYDLICDAISHKFQDLAVDRHLAIGFGVLTCETEEQAIVRADPNKKDYGGAAAKAALRMIELKKHFGHSAKHAN